MTQELTLKQRADTIQKFLIGKQGGFAALMPKHLTPERMVKGFLAAATRNPKLLECTQISILNTVLTAIALGLEIGRPRGGMYAIPFFNNKINAYEAVAVPDYRGLIQIAVNSGRVLSIEAREVYEGDEFDYAYGLNPYCTHKPAAKGRGDLTHVYAVAAIKDGPPSFEVMTTEDVDAHRARSKAKDSGPWKTDYPAMALKTVIKKLCNLLPQAQEDKLALAMEVDSRRERGEGIADLFDVIEIEGEEVDGGETETDKAKERLKGKAAKDDVSVPHHMRGNGPEPTADPGPEPVAASGPEPVAKAGTEPEEKPSAPYGEGNAMPTTDAAPPAPAEEKPAEEHQRPAGASVTKKPRGRPKGSGRKAPEPTPAEQPTAEEKPAEPQEPQGDPGPDEPAQAPAQPAPEPPPLAAEENGPQEGDPEVPALHSMHDQFISEGGGYAAAVTAFNKAWEELSEDNPRALAMMYAEKGATWSQFADSDDEIIALSSLKKHYFTLAAIEGFDQS